jgi:hypothetical protein|tara:strand:- start:450 stop:2006 length:1557 start_codon:yes stop_codon:yes gene_type:complete
MAKPLLTSSIAAPAFFGLNTQESGVTLQEGFALHADNCVIDKYGRLGARKGWSTLSSTLDTVAGDNVGINLTGLSDFQEITGDRTRMSWSATKFYKGGAALTTLTPTTTDTIAAGNWQAVVLNDHAYFYQRGYIPLIYTNETTADTFESFVAHAHTAGTHQLSNTALSAYGRVWNADTPTNKTTVWFSDVLNGHNFGTGTAGSIDISSVLTQGADEIVALGAHNGYLIIFCKDNIIIYGDNNNFQQSMTTTSLTLVEVIQGVGCVARDSVQNTGEDILFLSNTGVRSLNRTVQEKSQPMRDISKNVRDDIIQAVNNEVLANVKSVYSPTNAFYLLTFPATSQTFCFDTRMMLEDGSYRTTVWPALTPKGLLSVGSELYFAQPNGIAIYRNYLDDTEPYAMAYYSNYFDLEMPNINKIIKRVTATTVGASGQTFSLKIGYEYSPVYYSETFTLEAGTVYEYGIAEYGLAEYAGSVLINDQSAPAQGAGNIIQIGFTTTINGTAMSLQKLSIYAKQGKVL